MKVSDIEAMYVDFLNKRWEECEGILNPHYRRILLSEAARDELFDRIVDDLLDAVKYDEALESMGDQDLSDQGLKNYQDLFTLLLPQTIEAYARRLWAYAAKEAGMVLTEAGESEARAIAEIITVSD